MYAVDCAAKRVTVQSALRARNRTPTRFLGPRGRVRWNARPGLRGQGPGRVAPVPWAAAVTPGQAVAREPGSPGLVRGGGHGGPERPGACSGVVATVPRPGEG